MPTPRRAFRFCVQGLNRSGSQPSLIIVVTPIGTKYPIGFLAAIRVRLSNLNVIDATATRHRVLVGQYISF